MLLDKFEKVEITADSRISPADCDFCKAHQEAYLRGRDALKDLAARLSQYITEQESIISRVEHDTYKSSYLGAGSDGICVSDIYTVLDNTHNSFIEHIVNYFERKYKVTIEANRIAESLIPSKPSYSGWSRDEQEWKEYNEKLRALSLKYEDILDHIFVQLDGYSFQDKAVKELTDAAHKAAWNRYHGIKNFEHKKATISFTSYACHFDTWYREPHISLSDGMKNIIKALAYFEYGTQEYLGAGFSELCGYSFDSVMYEFDLDKVKSVKCFKNGRVDVKFTSEAYARQFADEYLGTEA